MDKPVLIANYYGDSGGSTDYYYWVQAIYPWGRGPFSNYAKVTVLSVSHGNVVALNWTPMPGATAYDVLRTTSATAPAGTITAAIALNYPTADGLVDNGLTAASYATQTQGVNVGSSVGTASGVGTGNLITAHAVFDFAVDGGVQGAITPVGTVSIPSGAVIVGATLAPTTSFTSLGSATVAVGTTAGSAANSIKTATAIATLTAGAVVNGTATLAAPVKMTAAGNINVTIATADLTAGKMDIYVYYTL